MSIIAYDAGLKDGKDETIEMVLNAIDNMMKNPPMRGDVALSDLRRLIKSDEQNNV